MSTAGQSGTLARQQLRPRHPHAHHSSLLTAVQSLLYLIVIALFIISFCVQPFRIPSGSMESTLMIGDFLLVNKQVADPFSLFDPLPQNTVRRGDIVVFHYPVDSSLHLVKRVIGLPGDHLHLRNGSVYVNGQKLDEPYAEYLKIGHDDFRDNFPRTLSAEPGINSHWWIEMHRRTDHGDLIVPKGHYFVLGDNRNNSEDSRYWGFVPLSAIVGKPFLIYFSLRQQEQSDTTLSVPAGLHPLSQLSESIPSRLVDLARWDRTFRIIQ